MWIQMLVDELVVNIYIMQKDLDYYMQSSAASLDQ